MFYADINGQPVHRHEKGRNVILFATLKNKSCSSFETSEVIPANTLGYHRKENYNNLMLEAQRHCAGFCCINRAKVTNGANVLNVNVNFVAYVLYMRVNSHVICKMESEVLCSSRE